MSVGSLVKMENILSYEKYWLIPICLRINNRKYYLPFARLNSVQAYETEKWKYVVRLIYFTFFDGKTQLQN